MGGFSLKILNMPFLKKSLYDSIWCLTKDCGLSVKYLSINFHVVELSIVYKYENIIYYQTKYLYYFIKNTNLKVLLL